MSVSVRPSPTQARDYAFPRFERQQLSNGLGLLVAPVHKLPIVTIHAVIDAGGESDPANKEGLAQLTARLLTEGAGSLDAVLLTERMELLGTSLTAAADWDCATVSASVMNQRFHEALATLGDVIIHPALPARELERLKAERLAELLQMRTEPRELADEMFSALLYDPGSRYSKPLGGWESSVSEITLNDVANFHGTRYSPASTWILVVGDVGVAEAAAAVEKAFGQWTGARPRKTPLLASAAVSSKRYHLVAKEGAPQSELRIGHVGLPRLIPDYFDVVVMNAILGGLFSSRVNLNLRERRGYTYGAFSSFDWRHGAGPFTVATAVKSDVTAESIREVLLEIDRMRNELITEDELSLALNYLMGVFPIRFETTAAIAGALAATVIYDLPVNYFDHYRANIGDVTIERVRRAAFEHLKPEELRIVVVGDPATVRGPLDELSAGTLVIADT